jgi:hypothetical protein
MWDVAAVALHQHTLPPQPHLGNLWRAMFGCSCTSVKVYRKETISIISGKDDLYFVVGFFYSNTWKMFYSGTHGKYKFKIIQEPTEVVPLYRYWLFLFYVISKLEVFC